MKSSGANDPAFPVPSVYTEDAEKAVCVENGWGGMTMREWYAGMALQGMLARADFALFIHDDLEMTAKVAAQNAFELADAMLAEARKGA